MDTKLMADLIAIAHEALGDMQDRIAKEAVTGSVAVKKVPGPAVPIKGSAESMLKVLEAFETTTKTNGMTRVQASIIAQSAGMNSRGPAGYYSNGLLEGDVKADSRWITDLGKKRLAKLRKG